MYPFTPAGCNFWSDLNSPPSSTVQVPEQLRKECVLRVHACVSVHPSVPADQQEWNWSGLSFHLLGALELMFLITTRFTYLGLRAQEKSWGRQKQLKHIHVDVLAYSDLRHKSKLIKLPWGFSVLPVLLLCFPNSCPELLILVQYRLPEMLSLL